MIRGGAAATLTTRGGELAATCRGSVATVRATSGRLHKNENLKVL